LIEAHQSEVTSLDFSNPLSGWSLLASGGQDRLIHLFDVQNDFALIQTLDDHTGPITSIKFVFHLGSDCLRLLSCSTDKSLFFRKSALPPVPNSAQLGSAEETSAPSAHFKVSNQVKQPWRFHNLMMSPYPMALSRTILISVSLPLTLHEAIPLVSLLRRCEVSSVSTIWTSIAHTSMLVRSATTAG
jgi:WD40 repeat protein